MINESVYLALLMGLHKIDPMKYKKKIKEYILRNIYTIS